MKLILVVLSLMLVACAGTKVKENGRTVFETQMNCVEMEYRSPAGSYLKVRGMNHSTPTRAGGSVVGTAFSGATALGATIFTRGSGIP